MAELIAKLPERFKKLQGRAALAIGIIGAAAAMGGMSISTVKEGK
jgi:hypothetical protein